MRDDDFDRKITIREELLRRARSGRTISYAQLGELVGFSPRGPWKPLLDEISREQAEQGLPDITFLVVRSKDGLPGQIDFKPANPPTAEQRQQAQRMIQKVFNHYRNIG